MSQGTFFPPFSRRRFVAAVGPAAAAVVATLWAGTFPNEYLLHVRDISLPHPYPWAGVLGYSIAIVLEAAVFFGLACVLAGPFRYLLAAILAGAVSLVFVFGSMHQPSYFMPHLTWLLACFLFFGVMFVVTELKVIAQRRCSRRAEET